MYRDDLVIVGISLLLTFLTGAISAGSCVCAHYQRQAIERGFAEYDGRTGEWKWKGE